MLCMCMYIMISAALRRSFSTLFLSELTEAHKLASTGQINAAAQRYGQVLRIYQSSGMMATPEYLDVSTKYMGCNFMARKYSAVSSYIYDGMKPGGCFDKSRESDEGLFLLFAYNCSQEVMKMPVLPIEHPLSAAISSICRQLLNKDSEINFQTQLPFLSLIVDNLNSSTSYSEVLTELIEKGKQKTPSETYKDTHPALNHIHPEIDLLYGTGLILCNRHSSAAAKKITNERINSILQIYEKSRPKQVYKPLSAIVMSLIAEKHYMSAEGMLGHIKSGESGLFFQGSGSLQGTQDQALVNNLSRLLHNRANNQPYHLVWEKEAPVDLGLLVAERIVSAPLHGHSVHSLIC